MASSPPPLKLVDCLPFIRFIQQPLLTITVFISSYFIYWHYALIDPIPVPLVILGSASIITYLESHLPTTPATKPSPYANPASTLRTSIPCALLLAIGSGTLWAIPGFLSARFGGDDYFQPMRETKGWELLELGVEQHHRTLSETLVVVSAIGLLCQVSVVGILSWGSWGERKSRGRGYAGVGEEVDMEVWDGEGMEEEDGVAMKRL